MPDAKEQLQQAISAARAGDAAAAKEMVELLLEDHPEYPHALYLRGMLAGNQAEQIEYLERVLAIDPDHQAAKRSLAQITPAAEEVQEEAPLEEVSDLESELTAEDEVQEEDLSMAASIGPAVGSDLEEEGGEPPVEPVEEPVEEPAEFGIAETIVTAAAIGAEVESVDDEATIFRPPASEDDEEPEEPAEEVEPAEASDVTVLAAREAPSVAMETGSVPEWLKAEAPTEELASLPETQTWADQPVEEEQKIPDWLSESPVEEEDLPEWLTEEPQGEWAEDPAAIHAAEERDEPVDLAFEDEVWEEAIAEEVPEEMLDAVDEAVDEVGKETKEEQRATSSGTRGLEITLIVLVLIAFVIVSVLLYVIGTLVF